MLSDTGELALQRRTRAHYEAYPFEFLTPDDEASIERMQPRPFIRFIGRHADPGMSAAEIGCGPGRGTMYLVQKSLDVTALDISRSSLQLARSRAPQARYVEASNLALPFPDASFDLVVSDGVIHHTPDAYRSFCENVRVLKPDGHYYLGVYNRSRYYYYLYTFLGAPLRQVERSSLGRAAIYLTVFPVYYAAHVLKSRGKRTFRGARNFFYDYLMTPRASFHSRDEIESWARANRLDLLEYDASLGNVHVFTLRKRAGGPEGAS